MEKGISSGIRIAGWAVIMIAVLHIAHSVQFYLDQMLSSPPATKELLFLEIAPSALFIASGIAILKFKRWGRLVVLLLCAIFSLNFLSLFSLYVRGVYSLKNTFMFQALFLKDLYDFFEFFCLLAIFLFLIHPKVKGCFTKEIEHAV